MRECGRGGEGEGEEGGGEMWTRREGERERGREGENAGKRDPETEALEA